MISEKNHGPDYQEWERRKNWQTRNFENTKIIFGLKKKIKKLESQIRILDTNLEGMRKKNGALGQKLKKSQTLSRCLREKTDKVNKENRSLFLSLVKMVQLYCRSTRGLGEQEISGFKYVRNKIFNFFQEKS